MYRTEVPHGLLTTMLFFKLRYIGADGTFSIKDLSHTPSL